MFYVILSTFLLLFCYMLNFFNINSILISIIFIVCMSFILILKILNLKDDSFFKVILILALLARIIFVFTDVYLFRLPDAGADDDTFYKTAYQYYINEEKFNFNTYGGYFTYIIYLLMKIIGSERIGVQYINVIFSMILLFTLMNILNKLKIDIKYKKIIMLSLCFMPYLMFSNSILRRDTLISTFLILSIKEFINWIYDKKIKFCIKSCLYAILASLFHVAVIFTFAIYSIFYVLYNHNFKKVKIARIGNIKIIIISTILLIFGFYFFTNFNTKFSSVDSIDDIYKQVNRSKGGSVYLTNVKINTLPQLIIWTPVKLFYFIFSPLPWNWRNILDMATFFLDSCVYLYFFVSYIKSKNKSSSSKWLFLCFLAVGLVFALGTFNSGTAIRHRYNILPFIVVAYAIEYSKKAKIQDKKQEITKYNLKEAN